MKEKHLYRLAGVFVLLLIIWFISKPRTSSVNYDEISQTIVFGFEKDNVSHIEVYKQVGEDKIELQLAKQGEQWTIPTKFNAKAKEYSVNRIINDILEMSGNVRSSDPKHFEMFKVSEEQGVHVILRDEGENNLANLIIGKKGDSYNSGFVRIAGYDKIYSVDKNILSSLSISGEPDTLSRFNDKALVDMQAVKLDKNELQIVALVANGREMVLENVEKEVDEADTTKDKKKEYEWILQKGNDKVLLDQAEVKKFLNDVTSIYAEEVVDHIGNTLNDLSKSSKYGTGNPSHYIVVMKKDDTQKYNIIFGKSYKKNKSDDEITGYYMNVQYDNLIYKVTKNKHETIFKWMQELPTKLPKKEEDKKDE